jgi:L-ribulose-5-phosphate 3-epimerase
LFARWLSPPISNAPEQKAKEMKHKIGVMQGRLVPKYKNQYQSHPAGYWDKEFDVAAVLGVDLVEFIVDLDEIEKNPLMSANGLSYVSKIVAKTGVQVASICADCFMAAPLHSPDPLIQRSSLGYLRTLIEHAPKLGVTDIVIPCVDQSSLRTREDTARLVAALESVLAEAELYRVNLSLETDLNPERFTRLLEHFRSPRVTVNYDTGNSASLGYDPREELSAYGASISDIHIKDRVKRGGSVPLGTGNANFEVFFDALEPLKYQGPFILQAYRDDEGIEIFSSQLRWIRPYIEWYGKRIKG